MTGGSDLCLRGFSDGRLLDNQKIAQELERRRTEIAEKTDIEISEIITALRLIAFGPQATHTERLRALELLGRHKKMFLDRRDVQFTAHVEVPPSPLRQDIERELDEAGDAICYE